MESEAANVQMVRIKRNAIQMLLVVWGCLFLLGGCMTGERENKSNPNEKGKKGKKENMIIEPVDFSFLEDEEGAWKDNTLDDWQAVINQRLEVVELEGENEYWISSGEGSAFQTGISMVSENGALYMQTPGNDSRLNEIRINGVSISGDSFSNQFSKDLSFRIGTISGKKGYIAWKWQLEDGKIVGYRFEGMDEQFQKTWELETESVSEWPFGRLMGDSQGYMHAFISEQSDKAKYAMRYIVLSSEGKLVFDQILGSGDYSFMTYDNGKVIIRNRIMQQATFDYFFYEWNMEKGSLEEIASFRYSMIKSKKERFTLDVTLKSKDEFVWLGEEGVYLYDDSKKEETLIYKWANHGFYPKCIHDFKVLMDGRIGILYEDMEGLSFLMLSPTLEKSEVHTLTIAVSPQNKNVFSGAVSYFSKRHPEYTIILKDDYDETSLLTELGAGDGPIIIDTALTGFEELENLWQPLDGFLEQCGVSDELIPEVLEFGRIGERTYGLVTNFYIRTLVMKEPIVKKWDYEGFLDYVEEHDGTAVFSSSYIGSEPNFREMFFGILNNGLQDNYYVDLEEGNTIFGTEKFKRVLRLAQNAKKGYHASVPAVELLDGTVLCEVVDVYNAASLNRLRERVETGEEYVVGYPTKDGARNLIVAGSPVAIRSTCTKEEKKVAYTFLRDMLTKEALSGQSYIMFGSVRRDSFTIRNDVLENMFQKYDSGKVLDMVPAKKSLEDYEQYQKEIKEAQEKQKAEGQKDRDFLRALLQDSKVKKTFPAALDQVFEEEMNEYLKGVIDENMVAEHLKSRFQIYLEE